MQDSNDELQEPSRLCSLQPAHRVSDSAKLPTECGGSRVSTLSSLICTPRPMQCVQSTDSQFEQLLLCGHGISKDIAPGEMVDSISQGERHRSERDFAQPVERQILW